MKAAATFLATVMVVAACFGGCLWFAGLTGQRGFLLLTFGVPALLALGGTPLLFAVFAVFFLVAAGAVWGLADPRGAALDER